MVHNTSFSFAWDFKASFRDVSNAILAVGLCVQTLITKGNKAINSGVGNTDDLALVHPFAQSLKSAAYADVSGSN